MKSMTASRSKVARGRGAKARVFAGTKVKTGGGLTKSQLMKNRHGKVVSKAMSAASRKKWENSTLKPWSDAVKGARKALGLTGFVAIKGKSSQGKALYVKAKSLLAN